MTLKSFHLVFIACSTALTLLFGAWALTSPSLTGPPRLLAGFGALVVAAALVAYERWFLGLLERIPVSPEFRLAGRSARALEIVTIALVAAALSASPAAACDVCYGAANSGSPLVSGARLGVFLLLGVTVAVLGGFVRFFLYLRGRARQVEFDGITSEWAQIQRSSLT